MPAPTVDAWVDSLQARGRYTFLRAEAITSTARSAEAVKKALQRLARRRRVVKVKRYFYVIVPLEYLHAGGPPPSWFIDDLMKAIERPYYVGLLSAAALHGASHQQPQEFQVFTDRPIRPLQGVRARIRFFVNKRIAEITVQNVKTATGAMRVSTPESTALDLVRFAKAAGDLTGEKPKLPEYREERVDAERPEDVPHAAPATFAGPEDLGARDALGVRQVGVLDDQRAAQGDHEQHPQPPAEDADQERREDAEVGPEARHHERRDREDDARGQRLARRGDRLDHVVLEERGAPQCGAEGSDTTSLAGAPNGTPC